MAVSAVFLSLVLVAAAVFVLLHARPLSEAQVHGLAESRRAKAVRAYFGFAGAPAPMDIQFKKEMKPKGQWCSISKTLREFPGFAAASLKYKKHEWIIVAFEKDRGIDRMWFNKGPNSEIVWSFLTFDELARIAGRCACSSVLVFHNHPNPNPSRFSCSQPSEADSMHAKTLGRLVNAVGSNLLEFVCERGRHYQFAMFCADSFKPLASIVAGVREDNGKSWTRNLRLHLERLTSRTEAVHSAGSQRTETRRVAAATLPISSASTSSFDWQAVTSSAFRSVGYDPCERRLALSFRSGAQYIYEGVPVNVFEGFLAASSKGRFYHANIRDRYVERPANDD